MGRGQLEEALVARLGQERIGTAKIAPHADGGERLTRTRYQPLVFRVDRADPPDMPVQESVQDASRVKELFRSGEYADIFNPEAEENPFREIYREKLEFVLEHLADAPAPFADLAGGPGRFTAALVRSRPRELVLHLDLSREMTSRARARACSATVAPPKYGVADAEHPPLRDRSIGTLLALDLLCHLPHPERFFASARRVLRPGGQLIIDNSNARAWWMFAYPRYLHPRWHFRRFWSTFFAGGVPPGWRGRVRHYRRGVFNDMIRAAGFELRVSRDFGPRYCAKWHLLIAQNPSG